MATNRHIIWDWNGTLLDDTWLCVEVLNALLRRRGRGPITTSDYRQHFRFPVVHFYEYLGFDTDTDTFETVSHEFIAAYEARWLEECRLYPQVGHILEAFRQNGMRQSILSAAKQEALEIGIHHYGIRHFFSDLVGADNIFAHGKVEQGRRWINGLACDPTSIVLIGDTLHDLEVARAIGCRCILLSHGHFSAERLEASGAPVAHSLGELYERLGAET